MIVQQLVCAAMAGLSLFAAAGEQANDSAVRKVLTDYEQGLNASDAKGITKLFTADAVVMAPNNSPAVGQETIGKVYEGLFKAVKLDIAFEVDEIKPLSDTWAFARTRSKFDVKVLGQELPPMPDANQELFLFEKGNDGVWRIARYSYSSTNPVRTP